MRIFVLNAYDDRSEKYKHDDRYELFKPTHYKDISDDLMDEYYFKLFPKEDFKRKVISCAEGHKSLLKKIIDEDLKDVVILEDDCVLDIEKLETALCMGLKLNNFTYLGGWMTSLKLYEAKDFQEEKKNDIRKSLRHHSINKIDYEKFKISHACCYFIPNKDIAQTVLNNIPHFKKCRAIDTEFMGIQKKGLITDFYYPALATLHIKDAKKGFNYSSYKLPDGNQQFY